MLFALLNLVSYLNLKFKAEYPTGIHRDELVIGQHREFKEQRAIEQLPRINAIALNLEESRSLAP
ncbi:MAG: hypothetical protein AAGE84_27895 [Cyanobacteria bacterium P01_G01_bin.39]